MTPTVTSVRLPVREAPRVVPGQEPYRLLFPLGVTIGLLGVGLWIAYAAGWTDYPGNRHASLLLQGFQQCFILGFLMTAMPAFLHAPHCTRGELVAAAALLFAYALCGIFGWAAAAQAAFIGTLFVPIAMAARRIVSGQAGPPPEEFALVGAGFATGIVGAAWAGGLSLGLWGEPVPRFGLRLVAFGMILPVVLGVGGLLVPTFMAMREPLAIPGIAKAHERMPRRILYAVTIALLLGSLALEAGGDVVAGARLRAIVGSAILLWVWKLFRLPGRSDRLSYALWGAGWLLFAGLWLSALLPLHPLVGEHVVFIGGFGFLTLGIGTRVVVRHGGHPLALESRVIGAAIPALLAVALIVRLAGEAVSPGAPSRTTILAIAAALWAVGWGLWGARTLPLVRSRPAAKAGPPPPRSTGSREPAIRLNAPRPPS